MPVPYLCTRPRRAIVALFLAAFCLAVGAAPASAKTVVRNPVDPRQQTALPFGARSHWLQPWKAYMDTQPATKLRDALGVNIDNSVKPSEFDGLSQLLSASGFKRARYEIGWSSIDYDDPSRLRDPATPRKILASLRANRIRPLILLNAHHGVPGPVRFHDLQLTAPAAQGTREVQLDAASAALVKPGLTGLNNLTGYTAAEVIVTRMSGLTATLSKPLPVALASGKHAAATLRYEPFGSPKLADGTPNPAFERTLTGWFLYVDAVIREARTELGSDKFDIEMWNELTFGSNFLRRDNYYSPSIDSAEADTTQEIAKRTVAHVRRKSSTIGITNGFESQRPWASGTTSPPGLTAISKHPYSQLRAFPKAHTADLPGVWPLDARGRLAGAPPGTTTRGSDRFIPTYSSFFPEYYLNAIQTETLIRDLSPIKNSIYGTSHGRNTRPKGSRTPKLWVTEYNLAPTPEQMPASEVAHMRAKATLRFLISYVNKGAGAVYFYAAKHPGLEMVSPEFFDELARSPEYPGDDAGGEVTTAMKRLSDGLATAKPITRKRALRLASITDYAGHKQFKGNGTAAFPSLYNRNTLAFMPFQLSSRRFVVPTYIMTRDLARVYRADGPNRYDMRPERYKLAIGGLRPHKRVRVSAKDVLSGRKVQVRTSRSRASRSGRIVVDLQLTDKPRLLYITEAP